MDHVKEYTAPEAVSAFVKEIAKLQACRRDPATPGLVGESRLNEGQGSLVLSTPVVAVWKFWNWELSPVQDSRICSHQINHRLKNIVGALAQPPHAIHFLPN